MSNVNLFILSMCMDNVIVLLMKYMYTFFTYQFPNLLQHKIVLCIPVYIPTTIMWQ